MAHDKNALACVAQAALDYINAGTTEHSAVMWGLLLDAVAGLGYVDAAGEQVAEAVADEAARLNEHWVMTGQ